MAELMYLPVEKVIPTKDNPRKILKNDPGIAELAKSIKGTGGVIQAVIARPHPTKDGFYELRAGERRLTASKLAGMETIKAEVVSDMTDDQARVITAVENLEREDLTPLEESRGIKLLMKSEELEEVANRLGKNIQWVHRRAQLMNLSSKWKKVVDNDDIGSIRVGHLELIARYDKAVQDELMPRCYRGRTFEYGERPLRDFERFLGEYFLMMSKARWPLDDKKLVPAAGACSSCGKRSSCHLMLFDDATAKDKKKDKCLDRKCWDKKLVAWIIKKIAKQAADTKLVILQTQYGDDNFEIKRKAEKIKNVQFAYSWSYQSCQRNDKGAIMTIQLDYSGYPEGQFKWMKGEKSSSGNSGSVTSKRTPVTPAEKLKAAMERLKAKRAATAIERLKQVIKMCGDLPCCPVKKIPKQFKEYFTGTELQPVQGLMKVVSAANLYGADICKYIENRSGKLVKAISGIDESSVDDIEGLTIQLWQIVTPNIMKELFYDTNINALSRMKEAENIAVIYNLDFKKIQADIENVVAPPQWVQKELRAKEAKLAKKKPAKKKKKK